MSVRPLTWAESACVLYLLILQHNLLDSWISAPFERGSWIPLLLWLSPFVLFRLKWIGCCKQPHSHPVLLSLALAMGTLGVVVSVHTLKNLAFVVVIGALMPVSPLSFIWLLSAIGWMRPLGYLGSYYFQDWIMVVRFLVVIPPTLMFIHWLKTRGSIRETA